MPLTLRQSDEEWSEVGVWLHSPGSVQLSPDAMDFNPVPRWIYHSIYPMGYMPISEGMGFVDPTQNRRTESMSWKPRSRKYDSVGDYQRYYSILASLNGILAGNSTAFNPTGEFNVSHKTYRGFLCQKSVPGSYIHADTTFHDAGAWGFYNLVYNPVPGYDASKDATCQVQFTGHPLPWWGAVGQDESGTQRRYWSDLDTKLDEIRNWFSAHAGEVFTHVASWGSNFTNVFSNPYLSYSQEDGFRIEYDMTATDHPKSYPYGETYIRRVTCHHTITGRPEWWTPSPVAPSVGFNTGGDPGFGVRFTTKSVVTYAYSYWEGSSYSWLLLEGQVINRYEKLFSGRDVVLKTYPATPSSRPEGGIPAFIRGHEQERLRFYGLVDRYANDIRASATVTTASALQQMDIGDNIQDILKLKDVSTASLAAILETAKDLLNKKVPTIKEVINLVTALEVQSQFEYSPEIQFITQDLPKLLSTQLTRDAIVGYGSLKYDFPYNAFGRTNVTLSTHTRVILLRPSNNFLAGVLGLRESGLDPGPSRVWHLVPFSFVVDWWAGIGKRMEAAESILLNSSSPIVNYVHSYTVSAVLEDAEVDNALPNSMHDPTATGDRVAMRWYIREVSRYTPPFRHSRFDYGLPTRAPDGVLIGSFVWQLLFA